MDINQGTARVPPSSPPRPLRIRKQPNHTCAARSQQQPNNKPSNPSSNPSYPPRTSSLRRYNNPDASNSTKRGEKNHRRQKSDNSSTVRSTLSRTECTSIFDTSIGGSPSTARSTVSNYKQYYLSGSSEIIGNFVPLESTDMAFPLPEAEHNRSFPNV
jgi:hypothetical protein